MTILVYLFIFLLDILQLPLKTVDAVGLSILPHQTIDAIGYFVSYLQYAKYLFPVDTLITATGIYIQAFIIIIYLKIVLWVLTKIPFFGIKQGKFWNE